MSRPVLALAAVFGLSIAGLTGCTSVRSTHVVHNTRECRWETKRLPGVPVTVKLPTHIEVRIVETKYLVTKKPAEEEPKKDKTEEARAPDTLTVALTTDAAASPKPNDAPQIFQHYHPRLKKHTPFTTRRIELDVREKEEVFTVDFVRPGAGISNHDSHFKDQFFTSASGKIQDKTIEDITQGFTKIIGSIGQKLPAPGVSSSFSQPGAAGVQLKPIDSVIAVRLFDIHDPDLENSIREFIHSYMNGCWDACSAHPATAETGP